MKVRQTPRPWVTLGTVAAFVWLTGCACIAPDKDLLMQKEMNLTKIVKKMNRCFRDWGGVPDKDHKQLFADCMKKYGPKHYQALQRYQFHFLYDNGQVAVSMCAQQGRNLLMEDLTCTPRVDKPYYRLPEPMPPCKAEGRILHKLNPAKDCPAGK